MEIDLPNSTNLSETDNWMFFDLSASCPVTKDAYRTFISSAGSRFAVIGLHPPFPSEWYWTLQKYRTSQIKYIVKASVTRGSAYDTGGIPTLDGDTQTLDVLNLQCLLPVTWNYTIFFAIFFARLQAEFHENVSQCWLTLWITWYFDKSLFESKQECNSVLEEVRVKSWRKRYIYLFIYLQQRARIGLWHAK